MKRLTVAGGVYHERCIWPNWDEVYGSAGRAAAAIVTSHVDEVRLISCIRPDTQTYFSPYANAYGVKLEATESTQTVSFEYFHSLSTPVVVPSPASIERQPTLNAVDEVVLRFGMLESSVHVEATKCIYDPQSAYSPEDFYANGSIANELAIVANSTEIRALSGTKDAVGGAQKIVDSGAAKIVVVKAGPEGAWVIQKGKQDNVPAFQSTRVWTIGTGDVFAAMFAARWGVHDDDPVHAAYLASMAVASYVATMALPVPEIVELQKEPLEPVKIHKCKVYLAAPFFCIGQRWIVDEARKYLKDFGMEVFSPIHDVGSGPAETVCPADLAALKQSDVIFALLDGLDPGTVFEVGYARSNCLPVYALAQAVSDEDLKMFVGSGCKVFDDFVTAIHHLVWRV
jgi:hypothetical protein